MFDLSTGKGYNRLVDKIGTEGMTSTALAFVGDAVYALYVRTRLVKETDFVGGSLHLLSSRYVNASAQASAFEMLMNEGELTQEEIEVAHRGKNAHVHTRTKAASVADYHRATGLEALVGYLQLNGDTARCDYILEKCFEHTHSTLGNK